MLMSVLSTLCRVAAAAAAAVLIFAAVAASGSGTNEHRINSASEFVKFSEDVRGGTNFYGTTVFLDSDIDFTRDLSQQFKPIGIYVEQHFNGAFDGQGHTISNLVVNSSSDWASALGLFGYTFGVTIRNVVIDESCSFTSSYTTDSSSVAALVGGIIAQCSSSDGPCNFEGCVNMADITFTGSLERCLCVGGIAGHIHPDNHEVIIKNCANYGSITNNGKNKWRYVGGIVGEIWIESPSENSHIQNCINYGTLSSSVTSENPYIGGIIGALWNTTIENCVNAGEIIPEEGSSPGNFAGFIFYNLTATITHCYFTKDTKCSNINGSKSQDSTLLISSVYSIDFNEESLNTLNEYAEEKDSTWNRWTILHLNGGKIKNVNQETAFVAQKFIPRPTKEGNTFLFWAKDSGCTEEYNPETGTATTLYAGWESNILTLDFGNGTIMNETFKYNATITYPENIEREGYIFGGWSNKIDFMPARDITITALWIPNNYTLTFDFGNGTIMNETFKYNATITYPENIEREGHIFDGWSNKTDFMPARDITVKAIWSEITEYVEINIEKKDLTESDVREIISQYVDSAEYEVRIVEYNEGTGETKVIIKFTDRKKTEEFVRRVELSSGRSSIKKVRCVDSFSSQSESFSQTIPVSHFFQFVLF